MKEKFLNGGFRLRWLNTAGFEIIMGNGRHILLDPFLRGEINGLSCYPISLDEIRQCDYLLLSHIHFDHAGDVGRIQKKFPEAKLFVGDLSADPLCAAQDINCCRLYRVRPGEQYRFDDLTIEVFAGRHTEAARGVYRKHTLEPSGKELDLSMWYGQLELQNYLLTLSDGSRILVWAGTPDEDQIHRLKGLVPDVALMHVSPKQDLRSFARLVAAIRPKAVIPHHYDCTEVLFRAVPELLQDISKPNREQFLADGTFSFVKYLQVLESACRQELPGVSILRLPHHQWFRFGLCCEPSEA